MDYTDTILVKSIFLMLTYVIEVIINVSVWIFIFKVIKNSIKRKNNRNYFINNIIVNKKIETNGGKVNKYQRTYNDVSKEALQRFNTDDINSLKEYFYDMFLKF